MDMGVSENRIKQIDARVDLLQRLGLISTSDVNPVCSTQLLQNSDANYHPLGTAWNSTAGRLISIYLPPRVPVESEGLEGSLILNM